MADFRINVIVDPSRAVSGARTVNRELDRTRVNADRLRSGLARTFAALGIAASLAGGVKVLADFSQAMSTVAAVTQAADAELENLTDTAKDLGATTRFSATEAANAMVLLGQAGFSVNQILETTDDVLTLAQAGGLGLAAAAEIAGSVLRGFRLEASQASRVVDVLASAAIQSNADVTDLGSALSFAAPIAAGLNIAIEETTAAIGALSDAGIKGTRAGRGLALILAQLESPTAANVKILQSLGLRTEQVRPSLVGLTGALEALAGAGIDTGQSLQFFGQQGGPAFQVLVSSIPKIESFTEGLEDAEGTAARVAKVMDDNLNGALLGVSSAFEALILNLGEAEGGVLRGLIESIGNGLRFLAANAPAVARALGATGLVVAVKLLNSALLGLSATIAANPLGFLLRVAILVIPLMAAFADNIDLASDSAANLSDVGAAAFDTLGDGVRSLVDLVASTGDVFEPLFGDSLEGAELSLRDILVFTGTFVDSAIGLFRGLFAALVALFQELPRAVADGVISALNGMLRLVETALDSVTALVKGVAGTIATAFSAVVDSLKLLSLSAGAALRGNLEDAEQFAADAEETIRIRFEGAFAGLGDSIKREFKIATSEDLVGQLRNPFAGAGKTLFGAIRDSFNEGLDTNFATEFIRNVLAKAETRAAERQLEKFRKSLESSVPDEGPAGAPQAPPEGFEDGLADGAQAAAAELQAVNQELRDQTALLELRLNLQREGIATLELEQRLRESGVELTDEQRATLEALAERNRLLGEEVEILERIRGPRTELAATQAALKRLLDSGRISQEEYNQALREGNIAALSFETSIGAGLSRGLEKIDAQLRDLATLSEDALVGAFQSAEDALTEFATTGTVGFRRFAQSVLSDIARLLSRLLLLQTIEAALGVLAPSSGGSLAVALGAREEGGPTEANRAYIVGEDGPEIFSSSRSGRIFSNQDTRDILAQAAVARQGDGGQGATVSVAPPAVNLTLVNLRDPKELEDFLESAESDKVFINKMGRNRKAVRREIL